jgi:hypothetical protein
MPVLAADVMEAARGDVLALDLGADTGDKSRSQQFMLFKFGGGLAQEGGTRSRRDRAGRVHHGGEFGVGE